MTPQTQTRGPDDAADIARQFEVQTALAGIAAGLVHAEGDGTDPALAEALEALRLTLAADYGSISIVGASGKPIVACRNGHAPDDLAERNETPLLEWAFAQVRSGNVQCIEPGTRDSLSKRGRESLKAAGVSAALFLPLRHGAETIGLLSLCRESGDRSWQAQDVAAARFVADLLATALERRRLQLDTSRRLQFESLIGDIASSLLRTPANLLDAQIDDVLRRLAEYLGATRGAVVLLSADGRRFGMSHEFSEPGAIPARETLQDLPIEGFAAPWRFKPSSGATIIRRLDELPESAEQTRSLLDAFGIASAAGVPLVLGSEVVGAIVFGRSRNDRPWDDHEIALLRASADIVITTIQRLRIESALRESDEKFSRTFLALPDAVTISEIETGRIVDANPAFESVTGFALSGVLGHSSLDLSLWLDIEDRRQLVDDVQRHGLVRNRETVMRHASGKQIDVLVSAVKLELRGRPYLCAVMRDITENKLAERALRDAESALRELNLDLEERVRSRTAELETSLRELESFSYSVSHDLRSPLRGINGFATLLAEDYAEKLDENGREYLKRIASATLRMGNLIDELLDLSRISRVPMRKRAIDLAPIARAVAGELRDAEPSRNVEVVIADILPAVADPGLMHVALSNLIGNAWKFTSGKASARIEVGQREVDGQREFYVRDDGAGFDMSTSQLLFRPFSRLHKPSEYPGTGIGLATVARIIQRHGGHIHASGEVGRGATFYFTLE